MAEFLKGAHIVDTYANTFFLVDQRLVLVDTATEKDAGKIPEYLRRLRMKPSDITTIFITHTHPDHVGGLAEVKQAASSAKVAAHRVEAPFISKKETYMGPPGAAAQRHPGTVVDVLLDDGRVHDGLRVIHTPGHTTGNIALLDETRSLLLAGDSINNEGELRPMDDRYNMDPKLHRASIKKLATFHFENLVMGHGTPILGGASKKVQEFAARL
ncbi:MAG TPA: MBL fold metallo-hydrolase [Thermoplasmata archaeon]|nr:MBL fold metallo-hydrolase [Thermoplasmata archaeon]